MLQSTLRAQRATKVFVKCNCIISTVMVMTVFFFLFPEYWTSLAVIVDLYRSISSSRKKNKPRVRPWSQFTRWKQNNLRSRKGYKGIGGVTISVEVGNRRRERRCRKLQKAAIVVGGGANRDIRPFLPLST